MKKKIGLLCAALLAASLVAEEAPLEKNLHTATIKSPHLSDMEHFNSGISNMEDKSWRGALHDFSSIREHYPNSQVYDDALYFQAVCNYHLMDYAVANRELSQYLASKYKLKFFEDALRYKLEIANKFKEGAKKHLFDSDKFPKWIPAKEDALEIYDEILEMVPTHDLAAHALYEKGHLLQKMQDYKLALENYQTLIKRFPKHPLTPEAYLAVNEAYYEQSFSEYRNTDLLEMAQINLKKFTQNFPRDERVEQAKKYFAAMKEIHAKGLYDIGMFYERTNKPKASVIYYVTALEKFPESESSELCKERLRHLQGELNDLQVAPEILK